MALKKGKVCDLCDKKLSKDEIGASKKLFQNQFYCFGCMESEFDMKLEDVYDLIEQWKEAGCTAFQ